MKADQQAEIVQRLRCAAGHLDSVIEMVEAGQPCEQVLHQLNAVRAALHAAGARMVHCEVQSIQDAILNSPSFNRRAAELKRLESLYTIFVQHFNEVTHD